MGSAGCGLRRGDRHPSLKRPSIPSRALMPAMDPMKEIHGPIPPSRVQRATRVGSYNNALKSSVQLTCAVITRLGSPGRTPNSEQQPGRLPAEHINPGLPRPAQYSRGVGVPIPESRELSCSRVSARHAGTGAQRLSCKKITTDPQLHPAEQIETGTMGSRYVHNPRGPTADPPSARKPRRTGRRNPFTAHCEQAGDLSYRVLMGPVPVGPRTQLPAPPSRGGNYMPRAASRGTRQSVASTPPAQHAGPA